jgi:glycosyltransferase involved in cell wall biosynthesis
MRSVFYSAFDVVPSPKGASTHITYFTRGLVEAGYQVQIATPGTSGLPDREDYFGAQLIRLPVSHEANYLQNALEFAEAVMQAIQKTPNITIAHFRSVWDGYLIGQAKERFGYRTVFEVNGLPSIELKYHYPALKDQPVLAKIKQQEIATLLMADAIVCPSGVTRAYLASLGAPRERITVIPNGVDTKLFTPRPVTASRSGPYMLLYVGTLADWQGLDVLVRALAELRTHKPVRLRVVGHARSRQRKDFLKRARKLGLEDCVSLEPGIPHHEIPDLLAQADVCVAPLAYNDRNVTQGCCPIKIIEYMACGRPLVAANLPVVRELVREDRDALLFTPDDPSDLARCITAILDDPELAARLSASAARRAHERFSWRTAQKKLLRVYEQLLSE